jgi:hypothetical protein
MRLFSCVCILLLSIVGSTQEPLKPAFTAQIEDRASCDSMDGYVEFFASKMREDPGSTGLIVITPDEDSPATALRFHGELRHGIGFKRFGNDIPVVKFSSPESGATRVRLYFVGNGNAAPEKLTDQPVLIKAPKRFFYDSTFSEACATIEPDQLVEFLSVNPKLNIDVEVYDDSRKRRRREVDRWFRFLIKDHKIDRRRIRFLLRNEDHSNGWSTNYTFVWVTS